MDFSVPDMSCGHCKAAVEAALSRAGAAPVVVDLAARRVTVGGTSADTVIAALAAAGFPATLQPSGADTGS
jgi:copper chaperone